MAVLYIALHENHIFKCLILYTINDTIKALGAFRTSPVASLYVEADEPSLYSRREKLSLRYALRLAANPLQPAHEVTFPPNYVDLYERKPKAIETFGIRISPLCWYQTTKC